MSDSTIRPGQIDPITFQVLSNAFMSVVDEMGAVLERAPLARRQRRARLQRHDLRRRRPPDRVGLERPARAPRHDPVHGQGRHRLDRRRRSTPPGRHRHHQRRLHRRHAQQRRPPRHAGVPRTAGSSPSSRTRRTGRTPAATSRAPSTRTRAARTARRSDHPADPPRARGRARPRPRARDPAQRAHARDRLRRPDRADRRRAASARRRLQS